ncbi:hypothetical protein [Agromyces aureus]|uniref:hypothetical protein n=1 Tax=Agromyces aureus TaxID=453304 RepID=UPI000A904D3B|nr:hypothetical protein [Agromyces aureus]
MSTEDGRLDVADETRDAVDAIEALPLDERAGAYLALAERLRTELEHSDPSRQSD